MEGMARLRGGVLRNARARRLRGRGPAASDRGACAVAQPWRDYDRKKRETSAAAAGAEASADAAPQGLVKKEDLITVLYILLWYVFNVQVRPLLPAFRAKFCPLANVHRTLRRSALSIACSSSSVSLSSADNPMKLCSRFSLPHLFCYRTFILMITFVRICCAVQHCEQAAV
jgi:hypothetical protein